MSTTDYRRQGTDRVKARTLQVTVRWRGSVLDVGHFPEPRVITMGPHPNNDFSLAGGSFPAETSYPLCVPIDGTFGVFVGDGVSGEIHSPNSPGQTRSLELMAAEGQLADGAYNGAGGHLYQLRDAERAVLKAGDTILEFEYTGGQEMARESLSRSLDLQFWRAAGISGVAHLALVLAFQIVPLGANPLIVRAYQGRFAKLLVEGTRPSAPRLEPLLRKHPTNRRTKRPASPSERSHASPSDGRAERGSSRRARPRSVKEYGLLRLLGDGAPGTAGPGGRLFGQGVEDPRQLVRGMVLSSKAQAGPAGMGGLGARMFQADGGGPGGMEIHGSMGSLPGEGGPARQYRRDSWKVRGGRSAREGKIALLPGRIRLEGSLEPGEIERVVARSLSQVRYCYERQLHRSPDLAGKIVVSWVIAPSGRVSSARVRQTTMNSEAVEGCLLRRVRRWLFTPPRGGGVVVVNYPFIFRKVGGKG